MLDALPWHDKSSVFQALQFRRDFCLKKSSVLFRALKKTDEFVGILSQCAMAWHLQNRIAFAPATAMHVPVVRDRNGVSRARIDHAIGDRPVLSCAA